MKTDSIKTALELKFGIKENYTEKEYNQITSIQINRFNIDKSLSKIDFTDLIKLSNLEQLTISNCIIDTNIISIILLLNNLNYLALYNCEIVEDITEFIKELKIKELILDNTNINLSSLKYLYLNKLILRNIDINNKIIINTNYLDIQNNNIKDYSYINLENINKLIISNNQYQNNKNIFDEYKNPLIIMEENGQFIKQEVNT